MYRTINAEFWTDPKVRALGRDAKLLFLYCITNPHAFMSGLYYLPFVTLCHEISMTEKHAKAAMTELEGSEQVKYSLEHEQVWVVNMLRYQGKGQKVEKGIGSQIGGLHPSPLIALFLQRYPQIEPYLPSHFVRYPIDTLSMGYRTFPSPDPDILNSSSPESGGEKIVKKRGATAFPEGWRPETEKLEQWRRFGLDPNIEFASFRDHARTTDRRCHDWEAAYRNWMRKAVKIQNQPRGGLNVVR